MPRDYKNRVPSYRRDDERRTARRRWMLAGGLSGVVAAVLAGGYWLTHKGPDDARPPASPVEILPAPAPGAETSTPQKTPGAIGKSAKSAGPAEPTTQTPSTTEPRFTFYKVLPEKEIIIPESEIRTLKREESLGKKTEPAQYMIQAGSFTSQQDADQLKTRLAQIKIKAKLELIKIEQAAWYRVKIGPYATLADADRVRQYLRTHRIDSVVQKAKPSANPRHP